MDRPLCKGRHYTWLDFDFYVNIVYNMQNIEPIKLLRARDLVMARLRGMITSGEFDPGARLEEVELSKMLGVSRTPVREALIALEQDGLVVARMGRGVIVTPADSTLVREAFPIVGSLEATALILAADNLQSAIPEMKRVNEQLRDCSDNAQQYHLDYAFHELLARACGNQRLVDLLEVERMRVRQFDGFTKRGIADLPRACADHAKIIDHIEKRKYDAAAKVVNDHWRKGQEVVIAWMAEAEK